MWYQQILYPLLHKFYYFIILTKFKLNFNKFDLLNYKLFKNIVINYTLLKLNSDFFLDFTKYIDCFLNFIELLPLSYKFYFRYRNKKYIELFSIKVIILKKKKIIFKILNESIIFFFKITKINLLNASICFPLKNLLYYSKFFNNINNKVLAVSIYYSLDLYSFYESKNLSFFFSRLNLFYLNFFKNV